MATSTEICFALFQQVKTRRWWLCFWAISRGNVQELVLWAGVGKPPSSLPVRVRPGWGRPHTSLPRPGLSFLITSPRGLDQMPFKVSFCSVGGPEEMSISQMKESMKKTRKCSYWRTSVGHLCTKNHKIKLTFTNAFNSRRISTNKMLVYGLNKKMIIW